ncbi:MAG: CPBP family intramembrane glutamic endopeptidase [Bacteroidota bacterium]
MTSILTALLQTLIIIILVVLIKPKKDNYLKYLLLFAGIFIAESLISGWAASYPFTNLGLQYNWIGKLSALLFLLLLVFVVKVISKKDAFATFEMNTSGSKKILALALAYLLIRFSIYFFTQTDKAVFHTEAILFQATLPGIEEELLFRGILLGLLNKIFTNKSFKFLDVNFGWGVILTSLLFGLVHGLHVGDTMHLDINGFAIGRTLADGFLFALLTEKFKSIVPAIIFHNLLNLIGNH